MPKPFSRVDLMNRFLLVAMLSGLTLGACAPVAEAPTPAPEPTPLVPLELERPVPNPIEAPLALRQALAAGTRTTTGEPGPGYWQQRAEYRIMANLDVAARAVEGTARIRYHNESPETLPTLFLHLHQNLHAPGVIRNEPQEVTGGMTISRVAVAGSRLSEGNEYRIDGTAMEVRLPAALRPGQAIDLEVDWSFVMPESGAGRMGYEGDEIFFVAYWFPQMAVFDDVGGWHVDPYQGQGEFYLNFADYDVTITAPEEYLVRATGTLENEDEVLRPEIVERLRQADASDAPLLIADREDFEAGAVTRTSADGTLDWRFRTTRMRDFTFSATNRHRWEAVRAAVGDRTGDGQADHTRVESLYRPDTAPLWAEVAEYGRHSVTFLSDYIGMPYPWPHMTIVEGGDIIGGGMEFPMITLIGHYNERGAEALYGVTAHEIAHMWIPMIVGSDEKRYAWLDEGHTAFHTAEAVDDFFGGRVDRHASERESYLRAAAGEVYWPMMLWTDQHPTALSWVVAMYAKPSTVLYALRGLLGEDVFMEAHRAFLRRWEYRLPTPWDFFNTFEDVSGEDLGWFWRSWYFETWMLDQAVGEVDRGDDGSARIVIEDRGDVPMPARVTITRSDGSVEREEIPVQHWLRGVRTAEIEVGAGAPVVRVEIDAEGHFPDLDRQANVWQDAGS